MLNERDLTHADRKQRDKSVQYVIDCVRMVEALGGEVLCLVPGEVGRVIPHGTPEEC